MSKVNKEILKQYLIIFKQYKETAEKRDIALSKLFNNGHFEGLIGEQFGVLEDIILDLISLATHIDINELKWFIYEADCGDNPLECRINDETIMVDSIDSFLKTII